MQSSQNEAEAKEGFVPRGAVAFFVALIVFFAAVWFGMYALMVHRNGSLTP